MENYILADICLDLVCCNQERTTLLKPLTRLRFILPILGEYSDAGYHEPNDKLRYSLRQNAQFYATALAAGIAGLVYVVLAYRLTFEGMKALVMALAYCWGLLMAIYLMGHGLVAIPRRLLRNATISGRLRRLQTRAPRVHEHMEDALIALEELEAQVAELSRRKTGTAAGFQDWIEELQELANMLHSQPPASSARAFNNQLVPTVITEKYLAELTRRLVRARHTRSRYVDEWTRLVREAGEIQAILDSAASKKLDFGGSSPHASAWDKMTILTPYTRHIYYYHVLPYTQIFFGLALAAASACIIWSEMVRKAFPHLSVIGLTVVHHWVGDKAEVGFGGQVVSALWICYMCAAALISMTEVKVWGGRALVKRNTAYESAFWYAQQVAKLCIPLSYNFMTFLSDTIYVKMTFYKFLGKLIDFTSLGRWFDNLFPVLVLLPVVATLFGLYGKIRRVFVGIDVIDEDEDDGPTLGTGSWREGRDLIAQELGGTTTYRRRGDTATRIGGTGTGGPRAVPVLSIPSARGSGASPSRSPARIPARAPPRVSIADEMPEDDNIFQILGHRMKNTVDAIEPPKWLQDIKKPKWMGGENNRGRSNQGNSGGDVRRWFGGEGQIRL